MPWSRRITKPCQRHRSWENEEEASGEPSDDLIEKEPSSHPSRSGIMPAQSDVSNRSGVIEERADTPPQSISTRYLGSLVRSAPSAGTQTIAEGDQGAAVRRLAHACASVRARANRRRLSESGITSNPPSDPRQPIPGGWSETAGVDTRKKIIDFFFLNPLGENKSASSARKVKDGSSRRLTE